MPALPAVDAIFLTHFDDIRGQNIIYFRSNGIPQDDIEHAALPSGLHLLQSDMVMFTHAERPGVGLFRNRSVEGGRGRRMGTLGVLSASGLPEDLFALQPALESIFDELEADQRNPFDKEVAAEVLERVWDQAGHEEGSGPSTPFRTKRIQNGAQDREESIRLLVEGRSTVSADHPIAYLPSLLSILGPLIIPVYRAALSGKRILLYSQPPLLPISAFAWCVAAMALSPVSVGGAGTWLGNVGLMDLAGLNKRRGGWVATTSDAIYRSHAVYDLFLDLSTTPPTLSTPPSSASSSSTSTALSRSYHLTDLPLYRSLLLIDASPPTISLTHGPSLTSSTHPNASAAHTTRSIYSGQGGWWLLAFDVLNSAWALCVGVCEYAVGRGGGQSGSAGEGGRRGDIHLPDDEDVADGEEDARLLPRDLEDMEQDGLLGQSIAGEGGQGSEEDEAVRRGRLILRQLYHSTYHLHGRLAQVVGLGQQRRKDRLEDKQVKQLAGAKLFPSAEDAQFWQDLARIWGFVAPKDDVEEDQED